MDRWIFEIELSGNLGIFTLRDGATWAKWVVKFDAKFEKSVIMSSFTLSSSWELERFGWRRRQVVFVSEAVSNRL